MRSYSDSQKSKKTVASMIERKDGKDVAPKKNVKIVETKVEAVEAVEEAHTNGNLPEDVLIENRRKLAEKLAAKKKADSKYVMSL